MDNQCKLAEQEASEAQFQTDWFKAIQEDTDKEYNPLETGSNTASEWMLKMAEQGEVEAQYFLGWRLSQAASTDREVCKEAVEWLRKAADQGHVPAQYHLGWMYAIGKGVPINKKSPDYYGRKDVAEAVKWYRKAAEQGYDKAQFALGTRYARGEGVPQDDAEAVKWLRRAAMQGHTKALSRLSHIGDTWCVNSALREDLNERKCKCYVCSREKLLKWSGGGMGWKANPDYPQEHGGPALSQAWEDKHCRSEVERCIKKVEEGTAGIDEWNRLGYAYKHGKGVAKDEAQSKQWYRKVHNLTSKHI